ncbi:MAG TPA: NTP transferase domain-containing protein [Kineosporiaceae bacterium]
MKVAGLLLAAGAGRRMGVPKGLVRAEDGLAWVTRSAQVLITGGCVPVLVVVGARAAEVAVLVPGPARAVPASDWAEGMGASLRAGLRAALEVADDAVAVVVSLVDTPGVTAEVVRRLAAWARAAGPESLARAAYQGTPGHPVVLGRAHWSAVADGARGDSGARGYLAGRDVVRVECGDVGDGRDVDTPG